MKSVWHSHVNADSGGVCSRGQHGCLHERRCGQQAPGNSHLATDDGDGDDQPDFGDDDDDFGDMHDGFEDDADDMVNAGEGAARCLVACPSWIAVVAWPHMWPCCRQRERAALPSPWWSKV